MIYLTEPQELSQPILQRLGSMKKVADKVFDYESSKRSPEAKATGLFGKRVNLNLPKMMVTFDTPLAIATRFMAQ